MFACTCRQKMFQAYMFLIAYSRTTDRGKLQSSQGPMLMYRRDSFIRSDGLSEMWKAVLLLIFSKTRWLIAALGRHLNDMYPLTICKVGAALVPDMVSSCEIWFQSIQMVALYLPTLSLSLSLNSTAPQRQMAVSGGGGQVMEAEEREVAVGGFVIPCWAFEAFERPCEHEGWGEQGHSERLSKTQEHKGKNRGSRDTYRDRHLA